MPIQHISLQILGGVHVLDGADEYYVYIYNYFLF